MPLGGKGGRMKSILFIFVALTAYTVASFASVGPEWISRYNGTANSSDWGYALLTDAAGNVYVTGYSTGSGTGRDYRTIKYDPNGTALWTSSYNGSVNGGDYSYAIALDGAGNVYVTGRADFGGTTLSDIVTIKYNSAGVQQWASRYNGPGNGVDEGKCIYVDASGNVYVGGKAFTSNSYDYVAVKYNSAGVEQWSATYNGPGNNEDVVNSMAVDNSSNVILAGSSIGSNSGSDFTIVKFNSEGTQSWVKRYNGEANGGDVAVSVKVDADGNIFAAGYSDRGGSLKYDIVTAKYDAAGNQQYMQYYNGNSGPADNFATAMVIDQNSNIYVTGASISSSSVRDSNYVTLKYNSSGALQWAVMYSGPNSSVDVSRSIFVDNSMNVYITGTSSELNTHDYVSVKYTPSGSVEWIMRYSGPAGDDYSTSITADNEGNAYVTGRSTGTGTDYDYATIKYGDLTGINPVNSVIPDKFNLYQNYPNPFNPNTKIKFDIPSVSSVAFRIYNSAGVTVEEEYYGSLTAGTYEFDYSAARLSSGVYFYEISAGSYRAVKKMILIK